MTVTNEMRIELLDAHRAELREAYRPLLAEAIRARFGMDVEPTDEQMDALIDVWRAALGMPE